MTNKEKFKEVFGLEIDDSADCGFFDCSDKLCKDCPVKETKSWWNTEYIPPQNGTWITMTYDAYVDLLSQTVKAQEIKDEIEDCLYKISGGSTYLDIEREFVRDKIFKIIDGYKESEE